MSTNKRTYPNDYFAWYNDDKRVAIVALDTSSTGAERTSEKYDTFQGEGSGGTVTDVTRSSSTATYTTSAVHNLSTNDRVSISGTTNFNDVNLDSQTVTVTSTTQFTMTLSAATGGTETSITATFTPLFISNGLRLTYHSKYETITSSSLTSELSTTNGVDTGLQTSLLYYVRARLLEDQGNLQQAQYYRQMFEREVKRYPSRKSGVRALAVPRL